MLGGREETIDAGIVRKRSGGRVKMQLVRGVMNVNSGGLDVGHCWRREKGVAMRDDNYGREPVAQSPGGVVAKRFFVTGILRSPIGRHHLTGRPWVGDGAFLTFGTLKQVGFREV